MKMSVYCNKHGVGGPGLGRRSEGQVSALASSPPLPGCQALSTAHRRLGLCLPTESFTRDCWLTRAVGEREEIYSSIYTFIHSFTRQVFIECSVTPKHEQNRKEFCSHGTYISGEKKKICFLPFIGLLLMKLTFYL